MSVKACHGKVAVCQGVPALAVLILLQCCQLIGDYRHSRSVQIIVMQEQIDTEVQDT